MTDARNPDAIANGTLGKELTQDVAVAGAAGTDPVSSSAAAAAVGGTALQDGTSARDELMAVERAEEPASLPAEVCVQPGHATDRPPSALQRPPSVGTNFATVDNAVAVPLNSAPDQARSLADDPVASQDGERKHISGEETARQAQPALAHTAPEQTISGKVATHVSLGGKEDIVDRSMLQISGKSCIVETVENLSGLRLHRSAAEATSGCDTPGVEPISAHAQGEAGLDVEAGAATSVVAHPAVLAAGKAADAAVTSRNGSKAQRVHASQDEAARKSVARAKAADAPAMPPLRGFKGHTFTTPAGRKLGAEEYLANLERMSKPPGFDLLEWNEDGTVRMPLADTGAAARVLPAADIRAMSERLCPPPAERPKRPPPRRPVWITRQLVDNKWQDVEQPWKRRGASAQREAMCAMFDRHKSDTEAKREKLVARYLQPLVKIPASTTTADADVQRYHYRLLKHQLAPKLQPQAKGLVYGEAAEE